MTITFLDGFDIELKLRLEYRLNKVEIVRTKSRYVKSMYEEGKHRTLDKLDRETKIKFIRGLFK